MITKNNQKIKNLLINTLIIKFHNLINYLQLTIKLFLKNLMLHHNLCLFKINNEIKNYILFLVLAYNYIANNILFCLILSLSIILK